MRSFSYRPCRRTTNAAKSDGAHAHARAPPTLSVEATKARHEAERQRLIAKLHDEAPKAHEKPAKGTVLDLPIFHRNDRP